jgi:hypothetical protein
VSNVLHFLSEQIGVPNGTPSVQFEITASERSLQDTVRECTLVDMKKRESVSASEKVTNSTFTKALASVLSASPKQIQESREQAKNAKFSSHTRYKYVPAKRP